jgi:hypothetical protein
VFRDVNTIEHNLRITEYKLTLDEYIRNEEKVGKASLLLVHWIGPSIRGKIVKFEDPKSAWVWLEQNYRMQDARMLDICIRQIRISEII